MNRFNRVYVLLLRLFINFYLRIIFTYLFGKETRHLNVKNLQTYLLVRLGYNLIHNFTFQQVIPAKTFTEYASS